MVSKQSRSSEYLSLHFVLHNFKAHTTPVRIYSEPCAHKFCVVDIFWNISRPHAISPIAKFHHVLERSFIIQRVIFSFIKCLSANQNKLVYMRVLSSYFDMKFVYVALNKKTLDMFSSSEIKILGCFVLHRHG